MATQVEESPLEAREDRLRRRAARKSSKADRLEAKGKTKRAAKKRGAAGVKTAKADKIAGKQDAKDAKQAGKQAKKLAKVKGKVDKKSAKKEAKGATKPGEKGYKPKKAARKAKKAERKANRKAKGHKVSEALKKGKKQAVATVAGAAQGAKEGYESVAMYGPSMGVHDADTDYRGHAMDNMGKAGTFGAPAKYDNAHNIGGPGTSGHIKGNIQKPSKGLSMYGKGSPLTKHFGRNRSKKR